ncbi:MAG: hypothetical protein IJM24_07445 [Clostridia bacterium]|nr:hypothetical protein [Clostridia bacterium]
MKKIINSQTKPKKKVPILELLVVIVTVSIFLSPFKASAAEANPGTVSVDYGDRSLQITLVETFDESVDNNPSYGRCEIENGDIALSGASACVDRYNITAPMLKAAGTLTGAKYVVLSLTNESDGEVWFCFQPEVPGHGNVFMGGEMGLKLYLVALDGSVTVLDNPAAEPAENNNRYGYGIPEDFDGFLFMPTSIFCDHLKWSTPIFTNDDPAFLSVGFNVYGDEPSSYFVTVHDLYIYTQDLPEYTPKPTKVPTAAPTEAPTAIATSVPSTIATSVPSTNAEQTAAASTNAPEATVAPKSDDTVPRKNNTWLIPVIIGGAAVAAAVVIAGVAASGKSRKKGKQ